MTDTLSHYQQLLAPSAALIKDLRRIEGDILILGAGGKMGPDLCRLARHSSDVAETPRNIIAVSRFSDKQTQEELQQAGIKTINANLLNDEELQALPHAPNVLYLAGTKFGTAGKEHLTWAMNSYLPGRVANHYRQSRIVVFSTGNVYPLVPVASGGATEKYPPGPVGEYAQSCLGRERVFEHFSSVHQTPVLIYRLNYANDVTYGVLLEIGRSVLQGKPIDLSMGHVNAIWQSDANEMAIRSLLHCSAPPKTLNVTGPETISVQWAAMTFGRCFDKQPVFLNEPQPSALLSNAAESLQLFGYPKVSLLQMIEVQAKWLLEGRKTINKPTHYQQRDGKY
ncbi:NAD-dependent epimerase/dehydratase family protein [Chitinophaga sp.]|uniref:NAD-dependent epimerase/dehydratase family protein n=1 Tax=Chitinophaga sp. TaxID=1869181 RepID=UPI0031DA0D2F